MPQPRQFDRQRPADVGEPAGLGKRSNLAAGEQDVQGILGFGGCRTGFLARPSVGTAWEGHPTGKVQPYIFPTLSILQN